VVDGAVPLRVRQEAGTVKTLAVFAVFSTNSRRTAQIPQLRCSSYVPLAPLTRAELSRDREGPPHR